MLINMSIENEYVCIYAFHYSWYNYLHILPPPSDESITGSGVIVAEEVPAAMQHDLHPSAATSPIPPPLCPSLHLLYLMVAHALLCCMGGTGGVRGWLRCWCLAWGLLLALHQMHYLAPPGWRSLAALGARHSKLFSPFRLT